GTRSPVRAAPPSSPAGISRQYSHRIPAPRGPLPAFAHRLVPSPRGLPGLFLHTIFKKRQDRAPLRRVRADPFRDPVPKSLTEPRVFSLLPKEDVFFDLFEKAAENVHQSTLALQQLFERFDDLE